MRATVADALGEGGKLSAAIAGFAPRAVQIDMAEAVADAIAGGETLVVEAGTGTGKTFAYLVPALLSGLRVIISTGTKNLQDQLFHRDLPQVLGALGVTLRSALLKGRGNYLCQYRLEQTVREGTLSSRTDVHLLQRVRAWAARTATGDIGEVAGVAEDAALWPKLTSTADNCLGQACPFIGDCFVVKARRAAQEADLVVVNHHLLFADLAIKREGFGEILPGAHAFIVDEAHQLPELAGQFFSRALSARQLLEWEADSVRALLAVSGGQAAAAPLHHSIERAVRSLRLALHGSPARGAWEAVCGAAAVAQALLELQQALQEGTEVLSAWAERSEGIEACHARALQLQERLQLLCDPAEAGWVHWYELSERGFTLTATPLDVAPALREFRQQTDAAWVFTSATLTVAGSFAHFCARMGLEPNRSLSLPSPFDYPSQALCYLPRALPDPRTEGYLEKMLAHVRPVLHLSGGRAFLLFTTHRALRRAAELLADLPYPLFVQGTQPRAQLLQRFRASGNGVLLGAASFWEGVDVRGQALSLVVIDKLPFAALDDPVLDARLRAVRAQGGDPFHEVQVPSAVIALKQGAGRLIRDQGDQGVLMLCDPRLHTARYGRLFLDSLPDMPMTRAHEEVALFFSRAPLPGLGEAGAHAAP